MYKLHTSIRSVIYLLLLLSSWSLEAQEISQKERRSFIGGTLGISIPRGDFASRDATNVANPGFASTGLHVKLVQVALIFKNNLGIAGGWYGNANSLESSSVTGSVGQVWGYGGILLGPIYTIPFKKMNFDIKAGIGYNVATILESSFAGIFRNEGETTTTIAYNMGCALRYHITEKTSLIWEFDLFRSDVTFDRVLNGETQKFRSANLAFGAAFRL